MKNVMKLDLLFAPVPAQLTLMGTQKMIKDRRERVHVWQREWRLKAAIPWIIDGQMSGK